NPQSRIGPYLSGSAQLLVRERLEVDPDASHLEIGVSELFNLRDVDARIPLNRMTAITGVSGAGKTALILDSLVPALLANSRGEVHPSHVRTLEPAGL